MTFLRHGVASLESKGLLGRIARPSRRPATRQSASTELAGMITLVRAVDHAALRDLIDGNPRR